MLCNIDMEVYVRYIHNELIISKVDEYLGTRIYYTKCVESPKYLLIGFNPGRDKFIEYQKLNNKKMCNTNYFSEELDYKYWERPGLPNSIKKIFSESKILSDLENNTMKINCHFQGTRNSDKFNRSLREKINDICQSNFNTSYINLQSLYVIDLIMKISPRFIIYEGRSALDEIIEYLKARSITFTINKYFSLRELTFYIQNSSFKSLEIPRVWPTGAINIKYKNEVIEWLKNNN